MKNICTKPHFIPYKYCKIWKLTKSVCGISYALLYYWSYPDAFLSNFSALTLLIWSQVCRACIWDSHIFKVLPFLCTFWLVIFRSEGGGIYIEIAKKDNAHIILQVVFHILRTFENSDIVKEKRDRNRFLHTMQNVQWRVLRCTRDEIPCSLDSLSALFKCQLCGLLTSFCEN